MAKDYSEQVHKTLTQHGFNVYVDHIKRDKKSGYIRENIDVIIEKCDIFILLNTIGSLDRDEVIREFNKAFPSGVPNIITKPQLFVFRDISQNVHRVTDKFRNETGVDLGAIYQCDFNT